MCENITLTRAEEKLAQLIWRGAPLTSPVLVEMAEREMNWKKSTTYTVLKKLCDKNVFANTNANVTVLLTQEELVAHQSRRYVKDAFNGSLPLFVAAFIGGKKLPPEQAAQLRRIIEEHEGSEPDG